MPKIDAEHEDFARVVEDSETEAEQNSQVAPYGTPTEPEAEQELNFGD